MLIAPSRPDWRWARVAELSQYSDTQALARLSRDDAQTKRAFMFKRAFDRGAGDEYPELLAAHDVFIEDQYRRGILEGFILTGASNEEISEHNWIDPSVVQDYHDIFFDVREGLKRPGWICSAVFNGMPHKGAHAGDQIGMAHRFAWFGGFDLFKRMVTQGLAPAETQEVLKSITRDVLMKTSVESALSYGSRGDIAHEYMRMAFNKDNFENEEKSLDTDYEKAIDAFFSGIGISVADSTDQRNLEAPKQEPREADYEVVKDDR